MPCGPSCDNVPELCGLDGDLVGLVGESRRFSTPSGSEVVFEERRMYGGEALFDGRT